MSKANLGEKSTSLWFFLPMPMLIPPIARIKSILYLQPKSISFSAPFGIKEIILAQLIVTTAVFYLASAINYLGSKYNTIGGWNISRTNNLALKDDAASLISFL